MQISFSLSVLAALCSTALALEGGLYTIRSASSGNTSFLTPGKPLLFKPEDTQSTSQVWNFLPVKDDQRTFEIFDLNNNFIDCNHTRAVPCFADRYPHRFVAEYAGEDKYELVDGQNTGYFLRATNNSRLVLADWDMSVDEQFHIVPYAG